MSNGSPSPIALALLLLASSVMAQTTGTAPQPSRLLPYTRCELRGGLAPVSTQRAPHLPMARPVETASGTKRVSVADGYRILLAFPGTDPFVNLKVEVSMPGRYRIDRQLVLEQMEQMAVLAGKDGASIQRRTVKGVEIAALDNPTLDFPIISFLSYFDDAESMIVSVYLLNQKPERRAFQDMPTFHAMRDSFIEDFVACMASHRRR